MFSGGEDRYNDNTSMRALLAILLLTLVCGASLEANWDPSPEQNKDNKDSKDKKEEKGQKEEKGDNKDKDNKHSNDDKENKDNKGNEDKKEDQ